MKNDFSVDVLCMSPGNVIMLYSATYMQQDKENICSKVIHCKPDGGVSVCEYLNLLGVKSRIYGFSGGETGNQLEAYYDRIGIEHFFVKTQRETSLKVIYGYDRGKDTSFLYDGYDNITLQQYFKLLHALTDNPKKPEYLIITGIRPQGLMQGVYADIVRIMGEKGVKIIADFSGQEVQIAEKQHPWLIITDYNGVSSITGCEVENKAQALSALKKYSASVQQKVLCICKNTGAVYSEGKKLMLCDIKPRVKEDNLYYKNAFTAAFMKAYDYSFYDVEYSVRYACAFANLMNKYGDVPQKSDIKHSFNETAVKTY